jgi:hypothetical protein
MKAYVSITVAILLTAQAPAKLTEGVYSLCEEVSGYSGEVVELKGGKFRYWFTSDVRTGREPDYPLNGSYAIAGSTLTLDHKEIHSRDRTIAVVNGTDVLWRDDGLKLWKKEQRIHPYAVLIRMPGATDGSKVNARPSIKTLCTPEMEDREKKEYEDRFKDQPQEVRALLRARTTRGDGEMAAYRKEIAKARENLDPKLVAQLVALMGRDAPHHIEARSILNDLYQSGWLIKDEPSFLKEKESKSKALAILIDGLAAAVDRYGVEDPLLLFLRVSGIGEINLEIPEAGVRIKLKAGPNDGYSSGSGSLDFRSNLPKTTRWSDEIKAVVSAVQKWMRAHVEK